MQQRNEIMSLPFPFVKPFSVNFTFVAFLIQINVQSLGKKGDYMEEKKGARYFEIALNA